MTPTPTLAQQIEWLSKDEAAEVLGLSPRRVLDYANSGAIQSRKQRDPKTNQVAVQLHAGDVARLREERDNPAPLPASQDLVGKASGAEKPRGSAPLQQPSAALVEALNAITARLTTTTPTPVAELKEPYFLTLKEARIASGLSLSLLKRQLVATGRATKDGRRWRIARTQLEQLAREITPSAR